jgi:hypothetical protein
MDETEAKGSEDKREPYILQISFWEPRAGPIRVWAKDKAHALEVASKMVPGARDLEIHDIALEKDMSKEDMSFEESGTGGTNPPTSTNLH